jgi:maltose alpha-D-glucosyltransferase/alpha-amylase
VDGITGRIGQVLEILRKQTTREAGWLVARAGKIHELIERLAASALGGTRTRIHGNLHLAQVLVVAGDACFVNFEDGGAGALHQSPLKDVADIMCSFNDAAALAIRTAQTTDVLSDTDEIRRMVIAYTSKASNIFFDAYFLAASELSQRWHKRDSEEAALTLFCFDNRAREILKAEHRPDWLEVPVRDLTEMILKYQH